MTGFKTAAPETEEFALLPKQVRYQDELHPEGSFFHIAFILSALHLFISACIYGSCQP
jgi:hypothetical protein